MLKFIDIHTHRLEGNDQTISVVNILQPSTNLPDRYFSSGWHPWHINNVSTLSIETTISSVCQHDKLIAIGECGLDRAILTPIDKQIESFTLQMNLARKYGKPLVVHCVKAYSDLLYVLKKENFIEKMVIHGFNGNLQEVDKLMSFQTWFSFGKSLLNATIRQVEVFRSIPVDRIFFETDEADYSIDELYLRASELLRIPFDHLIERIKMNFNEWVGYGLVE